MATMCIIPVIITGIGVYAGKQLCGNQMIDRTSGKFVELLGNGASLRDFSKNKRLSKLSRRFLGRNISKLQKRADQKEMK
jgi:hypothetical protein